MQSVSASTRTLKSWFQELSRFWSYSGYSVHMEHKKPRYTSSKVQLKHIISFIIMVSQYKTIYIKMKVMLLQAFYPEFHHFLNLE